MPAIAEPPAQNQPLNKVADAMPSTFSSPEFMSSLDKVFPEEAPSAPPEEKKVEIAPVKVDDKTPKPDDKKVAVETDEDPDDIRRASAATQSSWKKLKEAKKQIEAERDKFRNEHQTTAAQLKAAQDEMATLKAAKPPEQNIAENAEFKRLKQELQERIEKIRELDVREDKQFKTHFDGRMNQQIEIAKRVAGDRAVAVLKLPPGEYRDEQIEALAGELSPIKAGQLAGIVTRMDEIGMERENAIKEEVARYDQRRLEKTAQEQSRLGTLEKSFKEAAAEAAQNPIYALRDGDETWNKGLQERLALANEIYAGKLTPRDAATAALWSASAPLMLEMYKNEKAAFESEKTTLATRVSDLEAEIKKLRSGTPSPGGDGGQGDVPAASGKDGLPAIMAGVDKFFQR